MTGLQRSVELVGLQAIEEVSILPLRRDVSEHVTILNRKAPKNIGVAGMIC